MPPKSHDVFTPFQRKCRHATKICLSARLRLWKFKCAFLKFPVYSFSFFFRFFFNGQRWWIPQVINSAEVVKVCGSNLQTFPNHSPWFQSGKNYLALLSRQEPTCNIPTTSVETNWAKVIVFIQTTVSFLRFVTVNYVSAYVVFQPQKWIVSW